MSNSLFIVAGIADVVVAVSDAALAVDVVVAYCLIVNILTMSTTTVLLDYCCC